MERIDKCWEWWIWKSAIYIKKVRKEVSKVEISNKAEIVDLKYYYEEIDKWNSEIVKKIIIELYNNNQDERHANLYAVLLSKEKNFDKSNNVLLKLLSDDKKIVGLWNIYFNIAVNYLNIWDEMKTEEYLLKANDLIWDKENVKEFYEHFYGTAKKYNLDDFKKEIIDYYSKNDKSVLEKFNYINDLIDNIK